MTSLLDQVQTTLGGFDLSTSVDGLRTELSGADTGTPPLDVSGLASATAGLAGLDLSGITGVVQDVARRAGTGMTGLPDPATLTAPLTHIAGIVGRLSSADTRTTLAGLLTTAGGGDPQTGLTGVTGPLEAVLGALAGPGIGDLLSSLGDVLPGFRLDGTLGAVQSALPGISGLVRLVGALMAVESAVRETVTTAEAAAGMLPVDTVTALTARVRRLADTSDLVARVAAIDPDDPAAVALLAEPVGELTLAIRAAADTLTRGMAFGEATVVAADLPAVAARVADAVAQLDENAVVPVAVLATTLRGWLQPVLDVDIEVPAASIDGLWTLAAGAMGTITAAVDGVDAAGVLAPVTAGLRSGVAALHEVEQTAQEIVATVQGALDALVSLVRSLDLQAVTDAIHRALAPVVDILHDLEQLVGAAVAAIQTAAQAVLDAVQLARNTISPVAGEIHDAFQRLHDLIAGLHLEDLQRTLTAAIQPVVQTLQAAQLKPYFDAADAAIGDVASVVSSVPLNLLPADMKDKLTHAVAPIKAIDVDADVRVPLETQLSDIMAALDTDVLDAISRAQRDVIDFLATNDPRGALITFEHDVFDPFLAELQAVDPGEILAPVTAALDDVATTLRHFDLRTVLAPIDDAFTAVQAQVAAFDPAALIDPLISDVTGLRQQLEDALGLATWRARLTLLDTAVSGGLARLDVAAIVPVLTAAWDPIVAELRGPAGRRPSGIGVLITGLLQSGSLVVRPDAFDSVAAWLGGVDAAAEVGHRITDAAAAAQRAMDAARAADPAALFGAVVAPYGELVTAVGATPDGSLLRLTLEPLLDAADPTSLFGPLVANHARYVTRLDDTMGVLATLAAAGRSELTAVTGALREALRPLLSLPQRARDLLARFGVEFGEQGLRGALADVLAASPPDRVLGLLVPTIDGLRTKVVALVHDGLVGPLLDGVDEVTATLDAIDLSFVHDELVAAHDAVVHDIASLTPEVLLGDVLTAADDLVHSLMTLNPLQAVEAVLTAMRDAVAALARDFRPTVVCAPALDTYDEVLSAVRAVEVHGLLDPVLAALHGLEQQLDTGLDATAVSLKRLQDALP